MSKPKAHQVVTKITPSERGKSPCVYKSVHRGHTADPVPCYNRFDSLKEFDTQELDDQNENRTGHKVKSKVKLTKHSNAQKQGVHKLVQRDINSQNINEPHGLVDPVPSQGRFESLQPLYVQEIGQSQSQLSPVVIESSDVRPKANFSNNSCDKLYEQGSVE